MDLSSRAVGVAPPGLNAVPVVSVADMMRLVHRVGAERFLLEVAEAIAAEFRRWDSFDKVPWLGSHSDAGLIELMPTSDGALYGCRTSTVIRGT